MRTKAILTGALGALVAALLSACDPFNPEQMRQQEAAALEISVEEVAQLLSSLPLEAGQLAEVHDAASASSANGYDEEYRMQDLFAEPGSGVGDAPLTRASHYARPLRDLLREAVLATKAGEGDAAAWLEALSASDVQIYWPFSELWDGSSQPVITFDPGGEAQCNEGYYRRADGQLETLLVDEQMAVERPVWVVNRNDDAGFKSLEMLRRENPGWGSGGEIVVGGSTKAEDPFKTLILRSFKANRSYDSWLAGASEFFVKCGAIEDFTASTEAELRLYEPSITDFMIVVRRSQVGKEVPFNAILVSDWSGQLDNCAFMIIEDDGGTRTTWKCSTTVKYESKSYGFEIEIPLNSRDDIVWRGALTRRYIEQYSGFPAHFGDVELVLELIG